MMQEAIRNFEAEEGLANISEDLKQTITDEATKKLREAAIRALKAENEQEAY